MVPALFACCHLHKKKIAKAAFASLKAAFREQLIVAGFNMSSRNAVHSFELGFITHLHLVSPLHAMWHARSFDKAIMIAF